MTVAPVWLLLCATASAAPVIDVEGNVVLNDLVYRAVIALPEESDADHDTAELAADQARGFLWRTGYELARVEGLARDGRILLRVDEGRLAKIVFRGRGTLEALRLRLELALPHRVFNRPELEAELHRLTGDPRLSGVRWELRPVAAVAHTGPQLDTVHLVGPSWKLGGTHELFVTLPDADWYPGVGVVARLESSGIVLGGRMRDVDVIARGDRWDATVEGGMRLMREGESGDAVLAFHRARLSGRYATPPLWGRGFRPALTASAALLRQDRPDLGVERFWLDELAAGVLLTYGIGEGAQLGLGSGLAQRDSFAIEQTPLRPAQRLESRSELFVTVTGDAELSLDPWQERRDRRTELALSATGLLAASAAPILRVEGDGQALWAFGWHDLVLRGAAAASLGGTRVIDERPVSSRFVRGVFASTLWNEAIVACGVDFRYSLGRDALKLGVFHDLALLRESRVARRVPRWRVVDAFGPSLHALVLDAVQVDLYVALGLASNGSTDYGVTLGATKAY